MKETLCRKQFSSANANRVADILGPFPASAVSALSDLGLTDQEIADYFRVDLPLIKSLGRTRVPELRAVWPAAAATGIKGCNAGAHIANR